MTPMLVRLFLSRILPTMIPVLLASVLARGQATRPASAPTSQPAAAPLWDPEEFARVVQRGMQVSGAPSYVVGIVVNDRLAYARAFGLADVASSRPATLDTIYQVGSLTKTFTATLACMFRDDGAMALDDPAGRYLPPDMLLPIDPYGAPMITLRHLATHTSGLPRDPINRKNVPDSPAVMMPYNIADLHQALSRTRLSAPIGARWEYSNFGMGLLGHCIERVSGIAYESTLKTRLLKPLGMNDTTITLTDEHLKRFATHYWYGDKSLTPRQRWMPGEICGMAYIASTVPDLAKYVSMYLRCNEPESAGGPVVRGSTLAEMCRPQRMIGARWSSAQGIGWFIEHFEGDVEVVTHGGEVDGNSSFVAFSVKHGVGVIVLANTGRDSAGIVGEQLIQRVSRTADAQRRAALDLFKAEKYPEAAAALWAVHERATADAEVAGALGQACLLSDQNERGARACERAAALGLNRGINSYNAACGWAKAGKNDDAFRCLAVASIYGLLDPSLMRKDVDLQSLRSDPRFQKLLDELKG